MLVIIRTLLGFALLFGTVHPAAYATDLSTVVSLQGTMDGGALQKGKRIPFEIQFSIKQGWHVNSINPLQKYLIPTTLKIGDVKHLTVENLQFPPEIRRKFTFAEEELVVYEGTNAIKGVLVVQEDVSATEVPLVFRYQACDERTCLPPQSLPLTLKVSKVSHLPKAAPAPGKKKAAK